MAFTQTDVVNKAVILGNLDTNDTALQERVNTTAEMVIAKADVYLGYSVLTVDALKTILAEITVTQITHYQKLRDIPNGATSRVTRGDYTVEYLAPNKDIFSEYEWILKKYKKLRSL
jgi:hypothetical protein